MFGRTPTKTVVMKRHTEFPVRLDSVPITFDYDPDAAVAQFVTWVSKELDAGIQYRNSARRWEKENKTLVRDAQSFLDRARKAEARAEAAEKRLAEQPLYARAAKAPEVIERKIWRVRAKAVELAALAEFKPGDGLREQAEFWRAARKLGVPVDEVKDYALHRDVMEFYSWAGEPAGCSFNTMVYEIG